MHRVSVVDGNLLSGEEIAACLDIKTFENIERRLPQKGEIGCYLSHIKAWEAFLNSPYEYAIIFEDDVSFDPERLRPVIDELLSKGQLWDIVSFDVSSLNPMSKKPHMIKRLASGRELCVYFGNIWNASAYLIIKSPQRILLGVSP